MKKTHQNTNADILRAASAAARREDIGKHGRPTVFRTSVRRSKKTYSRAAEKERNHQEND